MFGKLGIFNLPKHQKYYKNFSKLFEYFGLGKCQNLPIFAIFGSTKKGKNWPFDPIKSIQ